MAYEWAQNKSKLDRAKAWVTEQVKLKKLDKVTEAAVKQRYVDLGGAVVSKTAKEQADADENEKASKDAKDAKKDE